MEKSTPTTTCGTQSRVGSACAIWGPPCVKRWFVRTWATVRRQWPLRASVAPCAWLQGQHQLPAPTPQQVGLNVKGYCWGIRMRYWKYPTCFCPLLQLLMNRKVKTAQWRRRSTNTTTSGNQSLVACASVTTASSSAMRSSANCCQTARRRSRLRESAAPCATALPVPAGW